MAGFKLMDFKKATVNKNLYLINGKAKVVKRDGMVSKFLNKRYSKYLGSFENRKAAIKGNGNGVASVDSTGRKTTVNKPEFAPRVGTKVL